LLFVFFETDEFIGRLDDDQRDVVELTGVFFCDLLVVTGLERLLSAVFVVP